jgi:hypothetical protein
MSTKRWKGRVDASNVAALKDAVAEMSDRQLELYANAMKAVGAPAHAVILAEIVRRCIDAYVKRLSQ